MANEQNLRPGEYKLSLEEAKRGGKASGKKRRKKKLLCEIAETLGRTVAPDAILDNLREAGIIGDNELVTYDEAVMLAQYVKAARGNTNAAQYIRDTSGQKPADKVNITGIEQEKSKLNELLDQRKAARDESKQ